MKRPQRNYLRNKAIVDKIYGLFDSSTGRPRFSKIHREYGVPEASVRGWWSRRSEDLDWRPYHSQNHGSHHRIFSDAEEEAITQFIIDNYFKPCHAFHDDDFRFLAVQAFLEKYGRKSLPDFQCSPGFIADFKARNHLSTRRAHYKRRPTVDPQTVETWVREVQNLLRTFPHDRVINGDETAWRILPNGATTWAERGSDSVVIGVQDDEKKTITVMASVTAAGTKLPLLLIANGLTELVEESQLGDVWPHLRAHSSNGWMNSEIFEQYLLLIRQQYNDDQEIVLILDVYAVHRCAKVRELASALKIRLIYIPAGLTDSHQPLDRRIFGALKSTAKHHVYRALAEDPERRIGMKGAVEILIAAGNTSLLTS